MAIGEKEIDVFGDFPVSILRTQQNKLLKNHVATLQNIKSVLSVGALQTDVDKEGEAYRNYFPDAQFYTLDKFRKDVHDKHLCMDLHDLSMMDKNFDLLLCMCVLEHVENPFQVAEQIVSCMHKGCYLFVCVPFFYPIHKRAEFSDYWRFSDDAIRVLFKDLTEIWMKELSSVIASVNDRDQYWDPDRTVSGYGALFKM